MKMVLEQLKNSLLRNKLRLRQVKNLVTLYLFLHSVFCNSQVANYVTNGGFENHFTCTGNNLLNVAVGWRTIDSSLYSSVQYYNPCYGNVPKSGFGGARYQWPRHGQAFGMTFLFCPPPYCSNIGNRGYMRNRLKANLIAGKVYCVKFYVNIANYSTCGIDGFGAYFGDTSLDTIKYPYIPLTYLNPQVQNPKHNVIKDTLNWVLVTGTFTALGNEKYLVLGNFLPNNGTDTAIINPNNLPNTETDVAFDDVSCIPIDLPAFAGEDKHIIPGETLYIGRQRDVGIDEACMWYKLPVTITPTTPAIDTAAGIFVSPIVTTTYVVKQDICGVIKYDTVVVFKDGVGLHTESGTLSEIEMYPNPAIDYLTLEMKDYRLQITDCRLQIANYLGQVIREEEVLFKENKAIIDISYIPNGVYIFQLKSDELGAIRKRIVISN